MTVKINTKDGQIELTDEVIATVVAVPLLRSSVWLEWPAKTRLKIISKLS